MIPTQYGNVPDVAFEEIQQYEAQQQKPTGPLPVTTSAFASTTSNPMNSSTASSDSLSSQSRTNGRDAYPSHTTAVTRSRSLASQSTNRPSVAAASTYISNPSYQTPLFTTNRQSFHAPIRPSINRLSTTTTTNPPNSHSFSSGSTIYSSSRTIPVSIPANVKHRYTPHHPHHQHHHVHQHHHLPNGTVDPIVGTASNDQQRARYDTTYRSSFIKPLIP